MWHCNMASLHDAILYGALWHRRTMSKHSTTHVLSQCARTYRKKVQKQYILYFILITILVTNPCIRSVFEHSLWSVDASTQQNLASKWMHMSGYSRGLVNRLEVQMLVEISDLQQTNLLMLTAALVQQHTVYEVNSIMAGQMPVLCSSTSLLLDTTASGLWWTKPRDIVKTHLAKNVSRYGWRNCETHALAELFCKVCKSGLISTNGLVWVVVP